MKSGRVARRVLSYYRRYKALTIGTVLYVLVIGVLDIAPPKLIQYVVDNLLQEQELNWLS